MRKPLRIVRKIIGIVIDIFMVLFLLFATSEWTMPEFWGSLDYLGHNLYLIYWEQSKKIIVLCPEECIRGRTCYSGAELIPAYKDSYLSRDTTSNKRQYVEEVKSNRKHIIVKTNDVNTGEKTFFIVDKSFDIPEAITIEEIRDRYIFETTDSLEFVKQCKLTDVDLYF